MGGNEGKCREMGGNDPSDLVKSAHLKVPRWHLFCISMHFYAFLPGSYPAYSFLSRLDACFSPRMAERMYCPEGKLAVSQLMEELGRRVTS